MSEVLSRSHSDGSHQATNELKSILFVCGEARVAGRHANQFSLVMYDDPCSGSVVLPSGQN
jgi:hypothetical protein